MAPGTLKGACGYGMVVYESGGGWKGRGGGVRKRDVGWRMEDVWMSGCLGGCPGSLGGWMSGLGPPSGVADLNDDM